MEILEFLPLQKSAPQIMCEHPKFIVIKDFNFVLSRAVSFYCSTSDAKAILISLKKRPSVSYCNFVRRHFNYDIKHGIINLDNYKSFYAIMSDGECIDLIIPVPCGHCAVCQEKKVFSFEQMCEFETLSHNYLPWFGTLTYDNDHLPYEYFYDEEKISEFADTLKISYNESLALVDNFADKTSFATGKKPSLCTRDIQLFLKRFRQNLKRQFSGKYNYPLRYVIVGEYGLKSSRPHYHFIFWNLHSSSTEDFQNIKLLIEKSWQNGFVQSRVISLNKDDNSFKYVAKYISKSGEEKTFRLSSRKNGGIGKPYLISQFSSYLQKSFSGDIYYRSRTGIRQLIFTRRVCDILAPSWSKLLPNLIRKSILELKYFRYLESIDNKTSESSFFVDNLLDIFERYMYIPNVDFLASHFNQISYPYKFLNDSVNSCIYNLTVGFKRLGVSDCFLESIDEKLYELQKLSVANQGFLLCRFSSQSSSLDKRLQTVMLRQSKRMSRLLSYAEIYG